MNNKKNSKILNPIPNNNNVLKIKNILILLLLLNKIKIIHKILRVDIQRISQNNGNLKINLKWRKITLRLSTNNNENNLNLVTIYNDLYNFDNEINNLNLLEKMVENKKNRQKKLELKNNLKKLVYLFIKILK